MNLQKRPMLQCMRRLYRATTTNELLLAARVRMFAAFDGCLVRRLIA